MKKALLGLAALGLVALAAPDPAAARVSVFFGLPGFGLFAGPPVVASPPVVYGPPAYYYGPPAYYYPPYRGYYGRPYGRGYGPYRGPRRGWYGRGRW